MQRTVARDWVHCSLRLVEQVNICLQQVVQSLVVKCLRLDFPTASSLLIDDVTVDFIIDDPALALLFTTADSFCSTADCEDITADVIIASKLHETQKPLNDKFGLGFNVGESSTGEISTQSNLVYDKFKKMNFVKASVIHNTYESIKYDDQTSGQLNQKGKAGIGYIRPENFKPSWLKNRLDKEKARDDSKSSVPHQPRRGPKKVKSVWKMVQPRRDLNGPHTKPKLNISVTHKPKGVNREGKI
ncbi:hypothetical protein F511_37410 [Dorcoceras hygrometricum]|uniref:Uncharacterized protein n=1 Tax=Dorcoceras hygrometricum TaxID=472368 RepID=A0A2Z7DAT2_9LAMI|nr:hypothetical protein F511_37410 [Dorcoceras hygrometricum]